MYPSTPAMSPAFRSRCVPHGPRVATPRAALLHPPAPTPAARPQPIPRAAGAARGFEGEIPPPYITHERTRARTPSPRHSATRQRAARQEPMAEWR